MSSYTVLILDWVDFYNEGIAYISRLVAYLFVYRSTLYCKVRYMFE